MVIPFCRATEKHQGFEAAMAERRIMLVAQKTAAKDEPLCSGYVRSRIALPRLQL
jgi:hypothetical protein